jgi:hypothetical protein
MSTQDWSNFGQVVGASSGALVGLLFVAVSFSRDRIAQSQSLRASASQTLVLFMLPLVVSILLLTPRQPHWVLGTELIALAVIGGLSLVLEGRGKKNPSSGEESRLERLLGHSSPNLLTTLSMLVAGVTFLAGHGGGLYWLLPAVVFVLVSGTLHAWWFLMGAPG